MSAEMFSRTTAVRQGFSNYLKIFRSISPSKCMKRAESTETQKTWKILKVNHIAVACGDFEKSVKLYRDVFGAVTSDPVPLPEHGVTTVFVELKNTKIELLQPLGEKSPIKKFLEKTPTGGMHHICIEVDNITNAMADLKRSNIRMLSEKPNIGAHGKPVVFLHPKDCGGVLIELEEV